MSLNLAIRLAGAAIALSLSGGAALAGDVQKPAAVVELFTSQGCSSCPPADALLDELVREGKVVALAYHVDYWDYLGWKDTLASKENTTRQHDYQKSFGAGSVYTPQAVVNGAGHFNGGDRDAMRVALSRARLSVEVRVIREGDRIVIEVGDSGKTVADANVMLVYFAEPQKVRIRRGENGGRTIMYRNAVSAIQPVGLWRGGAARFEMPASEMLKKGKGGCAVLLQKTDSAGIPGPILGAALIEYRADEW